MYRYIHTQHHFCLDCYQQVVIPMSFHLNLCFLTVFVGIAICSRCSPEDNPGMTLELPTTIELRFKSFLWTIVMTLVTEYSESQLPTDINYHLYLYICFMLRGIHYNHCIFCRYLSIYLS